MNRLNLLFALLLLSASVICAQEQSNHGLVVTGSVQRVEAKCVEGKPVTEVLISLQHRNGSATPLLLIGGWGISSVKFNFESTRLGAAQETVVAASVARYNPNQEDPFGPGTSNDYDPIAGLVSHPERWEEPDPLAPGGYWERPMAIWWTSGFKLSSKSAEAAKACRPVSETPVPDYPTFYLEFRTSLKKYARGDDVMRSLQDRWKSIGHLPLDSSGDISYKSERIIFPSPK
jgi:hypothetical protein